jgi:NAD(P) transhydrogenase subunit beta
MPHWIANLAYIIASVLFIFGIKGMTHPRTAVRGNLLSGLAMLIAVVVTLEQMPHVHWVVVGIGLGVGAVAGIVLAVSIQMTAMPQLVALFNGFGGGASIFVAWASLIEALRLKDEVVARAPELATHSPLQPLPADLASLLASAQEAGVQFTAYGPGAGADAVLSLQSTIATAAAGIIGAVTFWGSLVAFAKLQEIKQFRNPITLPAHQAINALLTLIAIAAGVWIVLHPGAGPVAIYPLLVIAASLLGILLVSPIGGADMPVVIALLNSYSGLAAAATGFVISNTMLIIAGSLVGASGLILTAIMCRAMNRSLTNVLFGRIEAGGAGATADEIYEGKIKATSADEIAMMLDGAQRVVVVPGYGMAVAQAQHAVRDLYNLLEDRGVTVEFAIHPVAGRMPGHMNVLLAEVDIPYEKLIESDTINPTLETADLAIILGANDVVNPDARRNDSPIAGMPIVDVDKARTVVVIKRSLSPGFAGIPNPLFAHDNTLMYFGDGKKAVTDLIQAIKES